MSTYHGVTEALRGYRSRRHVLRAGVGFLAGSAAVALACGGARQESKAPTTGATQGATGPAAAATQAPKAGGRLLLHWANTVSNFNPYTDWTQGFILLGEQVYDRLISTRPGLDYAKEYVLEAAQSVELPEPTTVVFKLKPGLKFQDRAPVNGRPVSAEDVVKSQTYMQQNPRALHILFHNVYLQGVQAPDAQTVVFKLKQPNAYLFSGTMMSNTSAQCIVPRELLDDLDRAWPVGSGPYQLAEYEHNVRYLFKRFPGYREAARGMPYIDERQTTIINDPAAQEAAFRSEQLHIWRGAPAVASIIDPLRRDLGARIVVDEWLSLGMWTLALNGTRPPWNDIRVREAIYRVTDRQQYLNLLADGRGTVLPGTLAAGLKDYQLDPKQTEKYWRQDARAAKQLLDAAGFPYDKEFEMLVIQGPTNQQAGEIFQQQVSKVGIKVRVVQMPFAEWLGSRVTPGNWDTWVAGHPSYDTPMIALRQQHTVTYSGHRYSGLKDPEVDKMIEKSEVTLDRNEHIKLVKDIQIALLEKYTPFIFLFSPMVYQPRYAFIKNYEVNPATNPMYRIEMWLDR